MCGQSIYRCQNSKTAMSVWQEDTVVAESADAIEMQPLLDPVTGAPRTSTNDAGGQSFEVDDGMRLLRFLILGTSGAYYARPGKFAKESVAALERMIKNGKGHLAVAMIREVSISGRAPRQRPTLVALAICALCDDTRTRNLAHDALSDIARTPTMLFEYQSLRDAIVTGEIDVSVAMHARGGTGWGRKHRRAVRKWYTERPGDTMARLVSKFRKRHGYSNADMLRLSHAKPVSADLKAIFSYITGNSRGAQAAESEEPAPVLRYLAAVEKAATLTADDADVIEACDLVKNYRLAREHFPTALLSSRALWDALAHDMPMTALFRNLGKLTSVGTVTAGSPTTERIISRLCDAERIKKARIHPMTVLTAHRVYKSGHGELGKLTWTPDPKVTAALEKAFELSFGGVVPADKRTLVALDVSGSMSAPCNAGGDGQSSLTCAEASAAMALITMRTEPACTAMCFSHTFEPLPLDKNSTLSEAIDTVRNRRFGMTDCSLPMRYASEHSLEIDTFVVYTDSETYFGPVHPCEALRKYRVSSGISDARLIVVGMASNGFSIADPEDIGMLDVVGFDAAAPEVMANFSAGRLG